MRTRYIWEHSKLYGIPPPSVNIPFRTNVRSLSLQSILGVQKIFNII